jgi:hypothetical protein
MDSDLFDEAVQLYTDAEDAKDSRLSDASKLPQELRKSKLCAMIKLARALRKSGRLALSINKLVNVISEISIKLARASRKRGRKQALLIRELTSDISEASSKECVFRLVSMLREIGGSCIAKGFLIKISDKRGYFWSVNVRRLIEKLNLDMRSKVSNAPHPQLILLRKTIEDEERMKAEEERLKDEEEKVKAQKEEKLAADKREHEQALRDEFESHKEDFYWGNSGGHTQLKPPCHEPVTTYYKSHFCQRSIEAIAHLHGFKCPQCHQGDHHESSVYLLQLKVTTASEFCPCGWCPQANPYSTYKTLGWERHPNSLPLRNRAGQPCPCDWCTEAMRRAANREKSNWPPHAQATPCKACFKMFFHGSRGINDFWWCSDQCFVARFPSKSVKDAYDKLTWEQKQEFSMALAQSSRG